MKGVISNGYRIARRLVAPALMLLVATSAAAEPIQYALVNATFADGGIATGYVVLDSPSDPLISPTVTDWAITVSGGNPNIPRFAYDPTTSTAEVPGGNPGAIIFHSTQTFPPSCGGVLRHLQIGVLTLDGASETCGVERSFVAGGFQEVPGPLITVKANNQHPASRTVFSGGFVRFSFDLSPAGSTADLDWYCAVVFDGSVYWLTPAGISPTPSSFGHGPAVLLNNMTLFFYNLGNITVTTWLFAVKGPSIVAIDHMTSVGLPSP